MKKKLLICLIGCIFTFSLAACDSEPVQVNVSNSENVSSNQFGEFITIGDDLVYDSATRVVYIENNTSNSGYCVYTPYYAPNGLPYRYDVETNTFEEIDN